MAVKTRVNVRAWSETTPGGTEYYIDGNLVLGMGAAIPLASLADFTRGDLIVGGAVQWQDLAHPGGAGRLLTTDVTDVLWSAYTITGTAGGTTHLAVTNTKTLTLTAADSYNLTAAKTGTLPVGTGTAGRVAEWVTDVNTLQASTLIKSGAGVLTLTAGSAYTVTVNGACALNDWFDQSVKQAASPTFAGIIVGATVAALGNIHINANDPKIYFDDNAGGAQRDFSIYDAASVLNIKDETAGVDRFTVYSSGLIGVNMTVPTAQLHVDQSSDSATIPVLTLDQADLSEEFINFVVASTGAGDPVDTATAVGSAYARLRIAVNGTFKYIQLYNA